MNAFTAHHGISLGPLRAALALPQARVSGTSRPAHEWSSPGWLETLVSWAERQPVHRRLGSYTLLR